MPTGVYKRTKYHNDITRRNQLISANSRIGKNRSKETKKKISESEKGKIVSFETRKKISLSKKGQLTGKNNPAKRLEVREKIKQSKLGKKRSRETRRKIGESVSVVVRRGKDCNFWRGGISYEPYSVDWTETLKRSIRERDNYICQLCSQYGNTVHHIDYNKKNNNLNNLVTLCNKCHSKTNFNRGFWMDYFGKWRGGND